MIGEKGYIESLERRFHVVRAAPDDEGKQQRLKVLVTRAKQELSDLPAWQGVAGPHDPCLVEAYTSSGTPCPNWDLDEMYGSFGVCALLQFIESWTDSRVPRWRAAALFLVWELRGRMYGYSEKLLSRMHRACLEYEASIGHAEREAQHRRAAQSRSDSDVEAILERLIGREGQNIQLWAQFYSALDRGGMNPEEQTPGSDMNKWFIRYIANNGSKRRITFKTFTNKLAVLRNQKSR
ncbi:ribosome biogenesis GTPase RsgA [Alcanivorax sp. NBRC 101098]|jgi:hypothetical protein|nr:ribosome biogenesis GTPase RsgA [Alcanivorax sp. NBRC 101098]